MRLTREECYEVLEVDEDATIEQIRSASIPNECTVEEVIVVVL
jgi:hypothetical protein